ncbi:MAG: hypothetical protein WBG50_15635 [Desulfomonilaceae bacterium]
MKKIGLVIALVVSLGLVCGICAQPASAFFFGGGGLGGGLFGPFWGGANANNCGYGNGYGYGYGYGVPYYGGYGCGPVYHHKVWKKRVKAKATKTMKTKKMKKMK